MIIAGGGTGGHLFPGLAVAEMLAARGNTRLLFVGSASGIEATVVPTTGFPFVSLPISGLRGRGLRGMLVFAAQLPVALFRAWRTISMFRPGLVLGLGGYGSVPLVVTAWLRRIPTVLLEQNAHPGLANRCLAHVARKVCTTFAESAHFFPPAKTVHTGNPVRQLSTTKKPSAEHFTVFAFGGSQGARSINRAVVEAAGVLVDKLPDLHIIHQTGAADVEWVKQHYQNIGVAVDVLPFVHDMASAYGRADLVVCRAGATTLAELTALGKAAILIPYPFAADDHQRANAEVLVRQGAAEMLRDADLSGPVLADRILALARDRNRLAAMGRAASQLAIPDAAPRVIEVCCQVVGEII